jgi:23S rRNA (guanosine2251-2'-O)-methyltransferase
LGRREHVYGRRAVEEAKRGRRRVHRILEAPETPARELERLAGSPGHQGVVAEVDPYPYSGDAELLGRREGMLVALDQIQDPQNLGAICRSAEVAGADGVVLTERRAAAVTPAVCKASAGAVEHLRIARVRNLADWLGQARDVGFWVWGADPAGGTGHTEVDLTGGVVLVLGGEGGGLRPRVAAACDGLLAIPGRGRIESLNVAAAASVLLFEALRQREAGIAGS